MIDAELSPVGQLLSALGQEFATAHGTTEPSAAAISTFRARAMARATELYGSSSPEMRKFTADLAEYLRLQYD